MSTSRTIQRSPDLGLGIRMQRLPEAVPAPVQQVELKPPVWWGWQDEDGKKATRLTSRWNESGPDYPYGYWPGLWVAVVEGIAEVTWNVAFTPEIWLEHGDDNVEIDLVWSGDPVSLFLPDALPSTAENLFTPKKVVLPDPLSLPGGDVSPYAYWAGASYSPGFPEVPMPSVIATGNTLSVSQDTKAMSGTLVADASAGGKKIGSVTLELMRVIHQVWS